MISFHRLAGSVAGIRKGRAKKFGRETAAREGERRMAPFALLTHPKFPFAIPFEHAPATQAIHRWKSLNKNDRHQGLCARET